MIEPEYEPARGIIRLPRAHLEAIVGGDAAVLDVGDERGRLLTELGIVDRGRLTLCPWSGPRRRPGRGYGLVDTTS